MDLSEAFLVDLADRGVRLGLDGDHLAIDGPEDVLTPEVVAQLTENKVTIAAALRILTGQPVCAVCGAIDVTEVDGGRHFCRYHVPTTARRRALVDAQDEHLRLASTLGALRTDARGARASGNERLADALGDVAEKIVEPQYLRAKQRVAEAERPARRLRWPPGWWPSR